MRESRTGGGFNERNVDGRYSARAVGNRDLIVPRVESKMTHGEQGGIHTPGHVSSAELFAVRWF